MTASATTDPGGAGTLRGSVRRITGILRRRGGRFRVALLALVLLLPVLLTMFLGEG